MRRIAEKFQRLFLVLENIWAGMLRLCSNKRGGVDIPDVVIFNIAQCLAESIVEFFSTEAGQKEFEEWLAEQQKTAKSEA